MEKLSVNNEGTILYQDKKGHENEWRKHQKSPVARDIWTYNPTHTKAYTQQTHFVGEDRDPVWASDNRSFYYLSEENGSFNIYHREIGSSSARQITHYTHSPVRFLSASVDDTLCFGYDGEIYTLSPGGQPRKVEIEIVSDNEERSLIQSIKQSEASEMAVSPDGKEVAFIVRGDLYVTSVEYNTTKRITNTSYEERYVSFSPDGRSLLYASERDGLWQIYTSHIVRPEEKLFTYATEISEERLTQSNQTSFSPQYSPDGKEVAFVENRTTLGVLNLQTKAVRTVMDGKLQISYVDGDQWYRWSPDGRWLLSNYIGVGGWHNMDIALIPADGKGEIVNLTQSGYGESNGQWVLDGKAMLWRSERAGYRSHGSWGADADVYIMFFDSDAYHRFLMNKEETAIRNGVDEKAKKAEDDKKKQEKSKTEPKNKNATLAEPLQLDLDKRFDRIVRLTVHSSNLSGTMLSAKGDMLYYLSAFEGGYDLWMHNLKDNSTKLLQKNVGSGQLLSDKEGKNIYLCTGGQMKKIESEGSRVSNISFSAPYDYRPVEERACMFEHIWRQLNEKFYVADMHGVNWSDVKEEYSRFLPHINNNYDFAEMLSEMLGELNASHTGAAYNAPNHAQSTATLGLFYDETHVGDGLKIKEIIDQSPLTKKESEVTVNCIIEKIDGVTIKAGMDYFPLLAGKVNQKVILAIYNPATGKRFEETIKPISKWGQDDLLYKRWVKRCNDKVEELSDGRIAYVHIKAMNSESFRKLYMDLLSEKSRAKQAVVVDTRNNSGGWLHDDVATFLNGKEYHRFMVRGNYVSSDPYNKWTKPSCMLVSENNYSNAHGTPFVYRALGIGKLVGTPVAGTMTAVWWERPMDKSIVFGIPQIGCLDNSNHYLENQALQPDMLQYNTPEEVLRGEDAQLKAAVNHLLQQLDQ